MSTPNGVEALKAAMQWMGRATLLVIMTAPGAALAQRATENAVASADDAFGSAIGNETTGIYTENDTRGFNPLKAGNGRIDGIYFDPVNPISYRLRGLTAIRIGFAAQDFPFQAPTGVVDYKLRPNAKDFGISIGHTFNPFGAGFEELDVRIPIIKEKLTLLGGLTYSTIENSDATDNRSFSWTIRPIARFGGVEFSPYIQRTRFFKFRNHPLTVVSDFLPRFPGKRVELVQKWAAARYVNDHSGMVLKASITDRLSLRGGLFHLSGSKDENYSEIYSNLDRSGLATHRVIADPAHTIHTTSGEIQLAYRLGDKRSQHRFIAGFRGRNRLTDNGGSDIRNLGQVVYGVPDPEPEPASFNFTRPNRGRIKQSAFLFGYLGNIEGLGSLNLGLQKARYRATSRDGRTGLITGSRDNPLLYNATIGVPLSKRFSIYLGTQRGLEDSGTAPENAANRNEQLPATRATQYDGGVRWRFSGGQLVVSAFQIKKPYFAFDPANIFTPLGTVRHRGLEASLSGQFGKRLSVIAGAVAIKASVSGTARALGIVGKKPTGVPSLAGRLDTNYRTDIFGGLTPTLAIVYTGKRALGARPLASLGGRQFHLSGFATVDLGFRQKFELAGTPVSYRFVVQNAFDKKSWKVVAPNTIYSDERRRVLLSLTMDI
jgi:iron complex outermembrane receptor protein